MKTSLLLLFLTISTISFAGDLVIPKGTPCPDGGHRSSNDAHWCCKDGFMLEPHSGKYDGVQAIDCGCPYGGTPSEACKAECCKDGYAFGENSPPMSYGSGKYDVLKPGCCCPDGGIRSETGVCCKDEYAFNEETNKYDLIDGSCGCPNGGQPTKFRSSIVCCNNGFEEGNTGYSHKENYKHVSPEICGCPENGTPVKTGDSNMGFGNFECCQAGGTGYRWVVDSYSDFTPNYCGCPDGGKYGEKKNEWGGWAEVPYCCKDGYLYDKYKTKSYSRVDIKCGCPKGHEQECAKQKEFQENPEKALKEFMAFIQDEEKMKKSAQRVADVLRQKVEEVESQKVK